MANLAVPVAVMANDKTMKARTIAPSAANRSQAGRSLCCPCSCLLTEISPREFQRTLTEGSIFFRSNQEACPSDYALTRGATSWHKERRRQIALGFGVSAGFWINQPNRSRLIRIERVCWRRG